MNITNNTITLDGSSLKHFQTCPREFEYHEMRKRELDENRVGMAFGRAFHRVRADHENGKPVDLAAIYASECVNFDVDDYRTAAYLQEVDTGYTTHYPTEPFTTVEFKGQKVIETAFAHPLGQIKLNATEYTIIWSGVIDKLTRWPDGSLWVHDYKTASVAGETFWDQFQNDCSQLGYCWAVQQIYGQMPAGYVIDAVFVRRPSRTGKGIEYGRQCYPVTPERISEWKANILQLLGHLFTCKDRAYWPMHDTQCVRRYGTCEYLSVCRLPPDSRDTVLNSPTFRDVTWNPLL